MRSQMGSYVSSEWNTLVPRQHKRPLASQVAIKEQGPNNIIKTPFKHAVIGSKDNTKTPKSKVWIYMGCWLKDYSNLLFPNKNVKKLFW